MKLSTYVGALGWSSWYLVIWLWLIGTVEITNFSVFCCIAFLVLGLGGGMLSVTDRYKKSGP